MHVYPGMNVCIQCKFTNNHIRLKAYTYNAGSEGDGGRTVHSNTFHWLKLK